MAVGPTRRRVGGEAARAPATRCAGVRQDGEGGLEHDRSRQAVLSLAKVPDRVSHRHLLRPGAPAACAAHVRAPGSLGRRVGRRGRAAAVALRHALLCSQCLLAARASCCAYRPRWLLLQTGCTNSLACLFPAVNLLSQPLERACRSRAWSGKQGGVSRFGSRVLACARGQR